MGKAKTWILEPQTNLDFSKTQGAMNDINKISSAYISGNEGKIKLKIQEIKLTNSKIKIKDSSYYYVHYYFKIDLNIDSSFELKINKAYLNLSFTNDKQANIYIGSFSYYKYQSSNENIAITNLKAITSKKNEEEGFYGFVLGIRNLSNNMINIFDIELLDTNIKKLYIKEIDSTHLNYSYDDYFDDDNYINEININKDDVKYFAVSIEYNDNDLMFPIEGAGIRLKIEDNDYIMEKFTFFKINKLNISNNFIVYEYKN